MITRIKAILFFLLIMGLTVVLIPVTLLAQVENEAEISPNEMRSLLQANKIPTHRAVNTIGSPFLNEEFHEGSVFLENGRVTRNVPIRYNTHEQRIDFLHGNEIFSVGLEKLNSFEFHMEGKRYRFSRGFEASGLTADDFVEVAADGAATFLVRHHTSLFQDSATYGVATQEDKYVSSEIFYIKAGEEGFNRIRRPNRRRVIRNFPDHREELEQYGENNRLDYSSRTDVARLTAWYNTLVQGE
ncbi:MAG TPA: hypothetical protein VK040_04860 [Balneolaceae bacterium]|nr:hypothetical protein [Balneolaceae bacterium]